MKRQKEYLVQPAPDGGKNGYLSSDTLETWLNENYAAGFEYVGMITKHHSNGWIQDYCAFRCRKPKVRK